jgi:hypothetical protein
MSCDETRHLQRKPVKHGGWPMAWSLSSNLGASIDGLITFFVVIIIIIIIIIETSRMHADQYAIRGEGDYGGETMDSNCS